MAVHPLQDGGSEQEFECAAHGEPLITTVFRTLAAGGVERGNAEPTSIGLFKLCEGGRQFGETPRLRLENPRKRESGS